MPVIFKYNAIYAKTDETSKDNHATGKSGEMTFYANRTVPAPKWEISLADQQKREE